ncbi:MAG: substrate-binding domain-containing protein [Burkholderiales bacterium]|nr:substrate-binding domain-containing protein [Burkholderiales bacterium]
MWCAVLAAAFFGSGSVRAEEIRIGGTGSALATMQLLGEAYARTRPGTQINVLPSLGSGGGIKAVLAGVIQIAVTSRPLKDAELKAGAVEIEYGRTPFIFATAVTNRTAGLTLQELADIYAGKTARWPDGTPIRLVLRPVGDSDSDMIKSMSAALRDALIAAEQRKGMAFAVTDQDAADMLEKVRGALGPFTLVQLLTEQRKLKALRVNNVEPGAQSIADGSYPYFKQLFMVTTAKTPAAARQFMAFVQSASSRELLLRNGYWVK